MGTWQLHNDLRFGFMAGGSAAGAISVCSGSVVVTAYDFEFARPGSSPEWGLIYY